MAGPTGATRLRAFVSRNSGRDRRARRLLGIGQASVLLVGLLLPTLIVTFLILLIASRSAIAAFVPIVLALSAMGAMNAVVSRAARAHFSAR